MSTTAASTRFEAQRTFGPGLEGQFLSATSGRGTERRRFQWHDADSDTRPIAVLAPSSTRPEGAAERFIRERVRQLVSELMDRAAGETFQPGVVSNTYRTLSAQARQYGDWFVDALRSALVRGQVREDITAEILRSLGRINDPMAHGERLKLLIDALRDHRPVIRDEAALALLDLGDPRAAPFVVEAAKRETLPTLRVDLLNAAHQMR